MAVVQRRKVAGLRRLLQEADRDVSVGDGNDDDDDDDYDYEDEEKDSGDLTPSEVSSIRAWLSKNS
jgi:hypothetical protein